MKIKIRSSRSKWDLLFNVVDFLSREDSSPRTKVENNMGLTSHDAAKHLALLEKTGCIEISKKQQGERHISLCRITQKGILLKEYIIEIYRLFGGKRPQW